KLGRRAEAQPWIDHAEALLRRRGQPDHERADWLRRVGMVEIAAGKHVEAESPLEEGLALAERVYGREHPRLIPYVNTLGAAKLRGGKYAEAQALLERAIALGEQAYGRAHPDLAVSLNNLALTYERQNRYEEAIGALQRSREIFAAINPKDPNIGLIRQNIGGMLQLSGKLQEALVELRAALAQLEATLGPDHLVSAGTYTFLGDTYRDLGDYPAARAAYERGCAIREQVLGAEHADLALCLLGQAQIDLLEGKGEEALVHAERALKVVEAKTPDPADLGLIHLARAKALHATGQEAEAREAAAAARASLSAAGAPGERGLRELTSWEAGLSRADTRPGP
ncbi:MAG TPA: tetratricopeptide repeat protein, partial [Nannocystis sp.]